MNLFPLQVIDTCFSDTHTWSVLFYPFEQGNAIVDNKFLEIVSSNGAELFYKSKEIENEPF